MKQLICEMCEGTEFIKQNGVFECQKCGTKYSVEEAKKMMNDETEKNVLAVKIEGTDKTENYYVLAETACDAGNMREAELYCNKVLENDGNNYKAWFVKGKAVGWQSSLAKVRFDEAINCFEKAISTAPSDVCEKVKVDVTDEFDSFSKALTLAACNHFAKFPSEKGEEELRSRLQSTIVYAVKLRVKTNIPLRIFNRENSIMLTNAVLSALKNVVFKEFYSSQYPSDEDFTDFINKCAVCSNLLKTAIKIEDDDPEADIERYKLMIMIHEKCSAAQSYEYSYSSGIYYKSKRLTDGAINSRIDSIMECHEEIKKLDSNYEIPERPDIMTLRGENSNNVANTASGGCYIATAVYGSYDCPQVWTLRRFRDYTLAETWYGRAFIHIYYTISPRLVKYFGNQTWFKKMWQKPLDHMVRKLKAEGVEDTPYKDKIW